MSWDRKPGGHSGGYFYESVRTPDGVKKVYRGRGTAGQLAAAAVANRKRERQVARDAVRAEAAATAEADRLTAELSIWADLLSAARLTAAGFHFHRGSWRARRDRQEG